MILIDSIVRAISKKQTVIEAPEGYCPNCWGRQEYGGKLFKAIQMEKIDLNNIDKKRGWIQAFAAQHLEGIKLQKTADAMECSMCNLSYKVEG